MENHEATQSAEEATQSDEHENESFPPPRFVNLEEVQPEYANYIHVLQDQYAFHVILSRIVPPVIRDDQDRDTLWRDGFSAHVVSRLIITPTALRDFIGVLSAQLDQFEGSNSSDDRTFSEENHSEGD